jgi:hypothetical protein
MTYYYANFGETTVAGGAGGIGTQLGIADTKLYVRAGDGATKYPSSYPFAILLGESEIVYATASAGTDAFTISRGQESTSAAAWSVGTAVKQVATAATIASLETRLTSLEASSETLTASEGATLPAGVGPYSVLNWISYFATYLKTAFGGTHWYTVASMTVAAIITKLTAVTAGTYNVKDYGALGDGSTDDTTAIAAAITAANAAGGGRVKFPAGTYITTTQTIYPKVHYVGDGPDATIIKLKASANADLFSGSTGSINLSAANKTGADGTLYGFSFRDLTLDGNNTNQSGGPSYPLRFYGFHYRMQNVDIRNGYSGVVLADWNGPDNQPSGVSIESQWVNVKIYTTLGGPLIQFGGPHDSVFTNCHIFDGKNSAYDSTANLTPGFHLGPNAAGCLFTNCHSWDTNLPWLIEAESYFSNCLADMSNRGSITGGGIGVFILASLVNWTGGTAFGASGSTTTSTGIRIGQAAGATPLTPYMTQQAAGVTTASAPSKCYIDTVVLNSDLGGINVANSGGNNIFSGLIHNPANSATGGLQGTLAASDTVRVRVAGITPMDSTPRAARPSSRPHPSRPSACKTRRTRTRCCG